MLQIYFLPHWCDLCNPTVGEALYDMEVMCEFAGTDLGTERVKPKYYDKRIEASIDEISRKFLKFSNFRTLMSNYSVKLELPK